MLEDSLYLENLREYVEDENRIVTYKWLSRKLEVPTDAAKKVLHAYLAEEGGSSGVTATYVITGFKDTDGGKLLQVLLVRDEELEAAKNGFQSVRSVHVYSVQKTRIQDSGTLFMANYDICREHISTYSRWSPVACPEPVPPSASTDPHLPASSSLEKNGSTAEDKKNRFPQLDLKKEGGGKAEGGATKRVKEEEIEKDVAKPSKSEMAKTRSRKPDPKKSSESKCKKGSRGSVATYFNKPPALKIVAQKTETVAKSSVKKSRLNDSDIDNGSDSGGESVVPIAPKPKTSAKVAREKRAADRSAKAPPAPLQRKRKRIQNTMSSDEEGDVVEKEGTKKAGVEASGRRRKRVKRLKSRMYTTDDGAMVTEKVWESESTDESDSETRPLNRGRKKAPVAPVKPVQRSPAKATKQSLISNFFKK